MSAASPTSLRSCVRWAAAILAIGSLATAGACSLNPQPIPPGYDGDEAAGAAEAGTPPASPKGDASTSADDAGAVIFADAAGVGDAANPPMGADGSAPDVSLPDASPDAARDGGDAGQADGGDAGHDGATDAALLDGAFLDGALLDGAFDVTVVDAGLPIP